MSVPAGGPSADRGIAPDPILELDRHYLADEEPVLTRLLARAQSNPDRARATQDLAADLAAQLRREQRNAGGFSALLQHYDLSSPEGIALMNLAEALLRIPDAATADDMIADRLGAGSWSRHLGASDSRVVNAATLALALTRSLSPRQTGNADASPRLLAKLLHRVEAPVTRRALKWGMQVLARHFVLGETIAEALQRAQAEQRPGSTFSFDMLGEAALTANDAARYMSSYRDAITAIADGTAGDSDLHRGPGISVKLSALSPRFDFTQQQRAVTELSRDLLALARLARDAGVALTVDAEEADRLGMTLRIFANVYRDPALRGWPGLGIAVQAYQKRALPVIQWLQSLAASEGDLIPVRLVKGAYWDTEIKRAQELGLRDYPVFTRKRNTDISYLACARELLEECPDLYPQFGTHNAHAVAYIRLHAGERDYEFQRLHGMGAGLYEGIAAPGGWNVPVRVYAPVGRHGDLLPYLIRRLLENGANSSFVNQVGDRDRSIEQLVADPVAAAAGAGEQARHPRIPLPRDIYQPARRNSHGINFADPHELEALTLELNLFAARSFKTSPLIGGQPCTGTPIPVHDPAKPDRTVGTVYHADAATALRAIDTAADAFPSWNRRPAEHRAAVLERAAELLETHHAELLYLCVRESGKTLRDGHADIREAVDFLRYYAVECRAKFAAPMALPGPVGESNRLLLEGRGVFLCISPWNFPVAIFTGQVAAALAAGNSVVAKPAEQSSLVAGRVVELLHQAGVPGNVLNLLPGDGRTIGEACLDHPAIAGVAFTGSMETARAIQQRLALRTGPIAALIAETGGLNAMIADSSALPEQLVPDVIHSAFNSTGQRCSALRVLYLQEDTADEVIGLLRGAMDELVVGDPMDLRSDVGTVIDAEALRALQSHVDRFRESDSVLGRAHEPVQRAGGLYFAPSVLKLDSITELEREVFGPVLHVVRYRRDRLDQVIADINAGGYGLTLGIHSRIESTARYIAERVRVGNVYINRNMIGALVGTQPFGGRGLSGTGPKAGGPHYLLRFATEKTVTINTAAVGGNASLLGLE